MACPHFDVSIRQRSKGKSAVAGAAYMAGEKLFSEYDQRMKNYRYKAKEVLAKGILLPPHAPQKYADRQTLWNAVETAEKAWNAQLARGFIMALPREIPSEQYEPLIRDYCTEQFVSQGMITDYAIHDKGGGNPHAHIMLTMRALDEQGKWLSKAKRVYALDENGHRIPLSKGDYKTYKERTTDWDDRGNCEKWRTAWADLCNRYLERIGEEARLDLRSYERQGVDLVPTIHLGPAVAHMEKKGIATEIGDYNRAIVKHNSLMKVIREKLSSLRKWLAEAIRKTAEIMQPEPYQPTLMDYVDVFRNLLKAGRADWGKKAKQTASVNDAKFIAQVLTFMQKNGIRTLTDFEEFVGKQQESLTQLDALGKAIRRKKTALKHIETFRQLKPISDKSKRGMGFVKKQFAEHHEQELNAFAKSVRYMNANGIKAADEERLIAELQQLLNKQAQLRNALTEQDMDPDLIDRIRHCVDTVIQAGKEPRERVSIRAHLQTLPQRNNTTLQQKDQNENPKSRQHSARSETLPPL